MREAELQSKCVRLARSLGWLAFRIDPKGNIGAPDMVFVSPHGRSNYVEFKVGRNVPTERQQAVLRDLYLKGAGCAVVYTVEGFRLLVLEDHTEDLG